MDKLNAISLFCKVVETQSFTHAAQQSNISLAMASKLVAQLEEHLKVRLLQRTTRKITPTEAGLLYYQRCLPIIQELQEAEDAVGCVSSSLQGKLSISVPMDFGSRFIAPNLHQFLHRYPHLQLNLEFNDRRVDVVAEGYDLVLRVGRLEDSSLVVRQVAQSSLMLVASPNYIAEYGAPQSLDDLTRHRCLVYENMPQWQFTQKGKQHRIRPDAAVYSNNGYALLRMARSGLGIVNLPHFLVKDELDSGELVAILPDCVQDKIDISLLYPHRRYLSPKVRAVIEFFTQLMEEQKENL